ncbi:MAG: sugar phosphate isomerase/epimerase [Isosphaeraceae bacterium]
MIRPRAGEEGAGLDARISRRDWLGMTAAGAGLGLIGRGVSAAAVADEPLRAMARKNLRLGIMSGVYAEFPVEEAARRITADGFLSVVSDFRFADVQFNPLEPDWDAAKKIVSTLEHAGIEIAGIFGYYNLVDQDPERRKRGAAKMEAILSHVDRLGCRLVSTGTGSFNLQSEWADAPENRTEEAYVLCRSALEKHVRTAEKHGAVVTFEPYYKNVISSIERAERIFREVPSPALRLVMDPCNYFRKQDLDRMSPVLDAMFDRLGDRIAIAHAKDVRPTAEGEDLPAAGLGVLDYPLYLRHLARLDRPLPLVLEHLGESGVSRARDFVVGQLQRV